MKKSTIIALVSACAILLSGCADRQAESNKPCALDALRAQNNIDNSDNSDNSENKDYSEIPCDRHPHHPEMGGSDVNELFDIAVSYANWTENREIYFLGLNADKLSINSVQHLPIFKFDTLQELENFKTKYADVLSMNSGYGEVSSFNETTEKYDSTFFEENTLMLTYVTSGSGSDRFGVNSIFCDGNSFVIHVEQTNSPEIGTCDMAGWFITVAVPDSMVKNCTSFDADFNNIG